jgi:hypothetical protein
MALIHPCGPSFAHWTDNLGDFSGGTSYGTQCDAGLNGGTPADASPATLLSALSHDCEYLILGFSGFGRNGFDTATLLDILYDPAGGTSWTELISDLLVGMLGSTVDMAPAAGASGTPLTYHFPLWIPAGSSIGVRAKTVASSALSTPSRVVAMAGGGNRNPASWWCGQKVATVGTFNQSTCRGQSVTPGVSSAMAGSWTNLGSTLSAGGKAAQWAVQGQVTSAASLSAARFEFGIGGVQIGPPVWIGMGQVENSSRWCPGPIFYDFPAGAQLQVRGGSSLASPGAHDVAAYIVQ